jgi:hypothetical protein
MAQQRRRRQAPLLMLGKEDVGAPSVGRAGFVERSTPPTAVARRAASPIDITAASPERGKGKGGFVARRDLPDRPRRAAAPLSVPSPQASPPPSGNGYRDDNEDWFDDGDVYDPPEVPSDASEDMGGRLSDDDELESEPSPEHELPSIKSKPRGTGRGPVARSRHASRPSKRGEDVGALAASVAAGVRGTASAASSSGVGTEPTLYFSKQARPVEFRPKTLTEYRELAPADGKYVELGKLGPDLQTEELQEKHEMRRRAREYARRAQRKNAETKVPVSRPSPTEEARKAQQDERERVASSRKRAMEFARHVPRPRLAELVDKAPVLSIPSDPGKGKPFLGQDVSRMGLDALEAEHDRLRAAVAEIRKRV